ncbi:MAG: DUF5330 domain-containing protein [Parvibaculum sp.]|jgi:hypothetical protein|uniref:DUF5330 domain-containing protein n=1 Tax=Parvibaculum sp. TaxID=2024848 RepID=UPI00283C5980|nr:DUF5330 domain-containing protein [Parvibaculum sp.]MDR3497776.1 DUF5330 domain-containing protein [Parvibaculum sp.]
MSFILRAAFWLTVLAFLLPAAGYEISPTKARAQGGATSAAYVTGEETASAPPDIDAGEMLTLAAKSAQDVMGFCGRNPAVCERGHAVVAHVARQSAYYGGQLLLWLTEKAKEQQKDAETASAIAPPRPTHQARLAGA